MFLVGVDPYTFVYYDIICAVTLCTMTLLYVLNIEQDSFCVLKMFKYIPCCGQNSLAAGGVHPQTRFLYFYGWPGSFSQRGGGMQA